MSTVKLEKKMKEQLLNKIQTVADNERFKQDAFFLCGASTGTPNDGLLAACVKYISAVNDGTVDKEIAGTLIAELEAAANSKGGNLGANSANSNIGFIKEILNYKDIIMNE